MLLRTEQEGVRERLGDLARDELGILAAREFGQNHGEFVAADRATVSDSRT